MKRSLPSSFTVRGVKFDIRKLKSRCLASIKSYYSEGEVYETRDGIYIYKDNGSNVLAVAHLDVARFMKHFYGFQIDKDTAYVYNTSLDDRLGAYVILDLLPEYGIVPDILLTEGEEIGRSTAYYFEAEKDYNWTFSFDRMGDDVVMYQYDSEFNRELLKTYKFRPARGIFSDICWLDHLGVCGFNFGVGYYDNHTKNSHARLEETADQVKKFIEFYRDYENTKIPYVATEKSVSRYYSPYGTRWMDDFCAFCGTYLNTDGAMTVEGEVCDDCANLYFKQCKGCELYYPKEEIVDDHCSWCEDDEWGKKQAKFRGEEF